MEKKKIQIPIEHQMKVLELANADTIVSMELEELKEKVKHAGAKKYLTHSALWKFLGIIIPECETHHCSFNRDDMDVLVKEEKSEDDDEGGLGELSDMLSELVDLTRKAMK